MEGVDILVLDDDHDIRESLETILRVQGYSVATAADGAEGLALLRKLGTVKLILLDLLMPVMNGWEFRERQSSDPALAEIPVIVISVSQNIGVLGPIAGFLRKPLSLSAVLAEIRKAMGEKGT